MPLWGVSTSDESKPKWLTTEEKRNCFATADGWVYQDPNTGLQEVLACVGGLVTKLGAATIDSAYILSRDNYGAAFSINVNYNEAVSVTGIPVISLGGAFNGGNGNCVFYAGNNTNELQFTYTPVVGDDNANVTIPDTITLETGMNIVTVANTFAQAGLNLEAAGYNNATNVKPTVHGNYIVTIPVPLSAEVLSRDNAASDLAVNVTWSNAVTINAGAGNPYILLGIDASGMNTKTGDFKANYSGGNATTTLTFTYPVVSGDSVPAGNVTYNAHSIVLNGGYVNAVANLTKSAAINLQTAGWSHTVNVMPSLATIAIIKA